MPKATEYLNTLQQLELLDPEQIQRLQSQAQYSQGDAEALLETLVQDGLLTAFQCEKIRAGKAEDLALGAYRLLDPIGEGGMGQVYRASQVRLNRTVAIKVLNAALLKDDLHAVRRFQREAQAVALLSHPNIVIVYDADRTKDTYYIAMEFVDGTDLSRLVKQSGPLALNQALEYVRQAAEGLDHAHDAGLVHRDIKPHNLLLSFPQPNRSTVSTRSFMRNSHASAGRSGALHPVIKILDLGLARMLPGSEDTKDGSIASLTNDRTILGTPDYIAPEQARDPRSVDHRADIYSLGCTLYFLLGARVPFPGGGMIEKLLAHQLDTPTPIETLRPNLPGEVAELVRKMMFRDPDGRFQTAREAADAIAEMQAGIAGSGRPPSGTRTLLTPIAESPTACEANRADCSTVTNPNEFSGTGSGTARLIANIPAHFGCVTALTFTVDGRFMATGGLDQTIKVFDFSTSKPIEKAVWRGPHLNGVSDLLFTPEGKGLIVASSGLDGRVYRWGWGEPGGLSGSALPASPSSIEGLAFSPNGEMLAAGLGSTVQIWTYKPEASKPRTTFKGHRTAVKSIAFAPDNRNVAVGTDDGIVWLWQLGRFWPTQKNVLAGHDAAVTAMCYSPDGRHLATGGLDNTIRIWDATGDDERPRAVLTRLEGRVRRVQFLNEGRQLLALSDRGEVIVWDLARQARVSEWQPNSPMINAIALANNHRLATSGMDGKVSLYALTLAIQPTAEPLCV